MKIVFLQKIISFIIRAKSKDKYLIWLYGKKCKRDTLVPEEKTWYVNKLHHA